MAYSPIGHPIPLGVKHSTLHLVITLKGQNMEVPTVFYIYLSCSDLLYISTDLIQTEYK